MAGAEPLYLRLLRLKHLRPSAWQRVLLLEGVIVAAVVVVLADKASLWTIPVLPLAVGAVVKFNDVVVGLLRGMSAPGNGSQPNGGDPAGERTPPGDRVA
jgi:hypothetical protein